MSDRNVPVTSRVQSWLRARHTKNEQFRQAVRAMNVDRVRGLSDLSDVELIATDPSIPGSKHQMEMQRRLKVAIEALTVETIRGRKVGTWLAVIGVVLTAVLVVVAVRS